MEIKTARATTIRPRQPGTITRRLERSRQGAAEAGNEDRADRVEVREAAAVDEARLKQQLRAGNAEQLRLKAAVAHSPPLGPMTRPQLPHRPPSTTVTMRSAEAVEIPRVD